MFLLGKESWSVVVREQKRVTLYLSLPYRYHKESKAPLHIPANQRLSMTLAFAIVYVTTLVFC